MERRECLRLPINVDKDGASKCIPAVYYKQGAYNFLKDNMLGGGTQRTRVYGSIRNL